MGINAHLYATRLAAINDINNGNRETNTTYKDQNQQSLHHDAE
jgi:hypothetical protein